MLNVFKCRIRVLADETQQLNKEVQKFLYERTLEHLLDLHVIEGIDDDDKGEGDRANVFWLRPAKIESEIERW
ncbi:hypothetical protein XH98_13765 [Bradyrhizobium sp. CCBAU 51745]|uniref:hypothetical protein n=1 Tax=Bradyrhizobium sp. CCBAU 51745 TaxID=1325099 RepID=UPI002306531E|nr:hypothetical protein [Bradyrhizobium sp. CCBAU 51745]MDA9440174.1 hypothetical protein [Bradyrhizobium sp. CCBAU 51745]